jgi:hypothetical protein
MHPGKFKHQNEIQEIRYLFGLATQNDRVQNPEKFFIFFLKMAPIGVFLCANRMHVFLMREDAFLILIQGRCIEGKIKTFNFLRKKWTILGPSTFVVLL